MKFIVECLPFMVVAGILNTHYSDGIKWQWFAWMFAYLVADVAARISRDMGAW